SIENSSYENLFILCNALAVPHAQVESLYKWMVLNVVYLNVDDHLKNHSFIFDDLSNTWSLAPAYDITYALNPLLNVRNVNRALSINGKRREINTKDLLLIADKYAVKNAKNIIENTIRSLGYLEQELTANKVPQRISHAICDSV